MKKITRIMIAMLFIASLVFISCRTQKGPPCPAYGKATEMAR